MTTASNKLNKELKIRDFGTAFCLLLAGCELIAVRPAGEKKVEFIFDDSETVRELANRYLTGDLTFHDLPAVSVIQGYEVIKNLKQRLHAVKAMQHQGGLP
jgi:hypothetical protein